MLKLSLIKHTLQRISTYTVRGKPLERVSPILVTLTSHSDSNFERSNISPKENKQDGVDLNSNGLDYCVRNNEEKILWFSADCKVDDHRSANTGHLLCLYNSSSFLLQE